jgi:hypothetical protein
MSCCGANLPLGNVFMKKLSILFVPTLLFVSACSSKSSTAKDSTPVETSVVAADSTPVDSAPAVTEVVVESSAAAETSALDDPLPESSAAPSDSIDSTVAVAASSAADDSSAVAAGAAPTVVPDTTPTQAVSQVSVQPGQSTDKFVGAASDVTTDSCKKEGGSWKISGKVKNSSGSTAKYRIYVALNRKGSTDTRGLLQVDKTVDNGKTEDWSTSAAIGDDDLICILRVERTAAK